MAAKSRWLGVSVAGIWIAVVLATAWSEAWRIPVSIVKTEWIRRTSPERIRYDNIEALEAEGRRIVTAIQAFEAHAGRVPATLDELAAPPDGWEDWRYRVDNAGTYSLAIGNYSAFQFFLRYTSGDDRRYCDA